MSSSRGSVFEYNNVIARSQRDARIAGAEEAFVFALVERAAFKTGAPDVNAPPMVGTGFDGSNAKETDAAASAGGFSDNTPPSRK